MPAHRLVHDLASHSLMTVVTLAKEGALAKGNLLATAGRWALAPVKAICEGGSLSNCRSQAYLAFSVGSASCSSVIRFRPPRAMRK